MIDQFLKYLLENPANTLMNCSLCQSHPMKALHLNPLIQLTDSLFLVHRTLRYSQLFLNLNTSQLNLFYLIYFLHLWTKELTLRQNPPFIVCYVKKKCNTTVGVVKSLRGESLRVIWQHRQTRSGHGISRGLVDQQKACIRKVVGWEVWETEEA